MKTTPVLLAILFPFFAIASTSIKNSDTSYIHIEYWGEPTKPYSSLYFYLPGSIDTSHEDFFIHKIKITSIQFQCIKGVIENEEPRLAGNLLYYPIAISIVNNGKKSLLLLKDREQINKIFEGIIRELKGVVEEKEIKSTIVGLLRRLQIHGLLIDI